MKIKTISMPFDKVMALPRPAHKHPLKPSAILRAVARISSFSDLRDVGFTYASEHMEKAGNGPWLILMNHSSFLDLEIATKILRNKHYNIICTSDGLVGKESLLRHLGCIPTQKFVTDFTLISDIKFALSKNHTSVLMYPEASYSFDGTATPLPRKLGILFKRLNVPVVMITAYGSFTRDPLYNNLQKRKVKVSAKIECLLSADEIQSKSIDEIDTILDRAFSFDYFRWQSDNGVETDEPFRADDLNRILFRCPVCGTEGKLTGKGTLLSCECGAEWEMDTLGRLRNKDNLGFSHIPDWYAWERSQIKNEIADGTYSLDTDVNIGVIVDYKALYMTGHGHLHHDRNGFTLDSDDGLIHYTQSPLASYSLYSDYYWYEIGDMICIGTKDCLYYCFPEKKDVAAKTRIAAEELYKLLKK